MRAALLTDFLLGIALQVFTANKNLKAVNYIKKVMALKKAGADVNDHMQQVANYLQGGKAPDYADLNRRIKAETDELLAR